MKNEFIVVCCLFACLFAAYKYLQANNVTQGVKTSYIPINGFVPNEEAAVKIAEAIWLPIYGENVLNKKPYHAKLYGDTVWIVEGSLPKSTAKEGGIVFRAGGVPYIEIRKSNCEILKVTHGK